MANMYQRGQYSLDLNPPVKGLPHIIVIEHIIIPPGSDPDPDKVNINNDVSTTPIARGLTEDGHIYFRLPTDDGRIVHIWADIVSVVGEAVTAIGYYAVRTPRSLGRDGSPDKQLMGDDGGAVITKPPA